MLDTHVWIWIFEGSRHRLARSLPGRVERAAADGALFVSAISIWELAMFVAVGRLVLSRDLRSWVGAARRAPGARVVPIGAAVSLQAASLPRGLRGDPADHLIAATARRIGAWLVTADERLIEYGANGHVKVIDARP